jgi:hypothetical protein
MVELHRLSVGAAGRETGLPSAPPPAPATTTRSEVVPWRPPAFVAVTVCRAAGLGARGVPAIAPVPGSRPSPAGSGGEIANVASRMPVAAGRSGCS